MQTNQHAKPINKPALMMSPFMSRLLNKKLLHLHFLIALIFCGPVFSAQLSAFNVDYDFSINGATVAHMTRSLHPDNNHKNNNRYIFESSSKASGLLSWFFKGNIVERSSWIYADNNIRPIHYLYNRSGKRKRHVELNFDWEKKIVTNTINSDPWTMAITDTTLDKLLYQLKMMFDLQKQVKNLDYAIADGGKLKNYHFELLGEETIKLPLGSIKTVKLRKQNSKRTTTVWCAKEYSYLPIRIEHIDKDGRKLKTEAVKINGLPFKSSPKS